MVIDASGMSCMSWKILLHEDNASAEKKRKIPVNFSFMKDLGLKRRYVGGYHSAGML